MNRFSIRRKPLQTLNVIFGDERTEDEVMAELNRLYVRVKQIHELATMISRKVEQISPDIAKLKDKDAEKILKKLPEEALSVILKEKGCDIANEFPGMSLLAEIVLETANLEHQLAQSKMDLYDNIQKTILAPMENITSDDFKAMQKNMSHLKTLSLNVDVAKLAQKDALERSAKFERSPAKPGEESSWLQKQSELKEKSTQSEDEVEIATSSMEHTKDAVATNLLNFVCKEHDISDMVLELLGAQQKYHESCAKQIKAVLPELRHKSNSFEHKPMYGVPLRSHLEVIRREIAVPIEECCSVIYYTGIKEEGLLRIPGNAAKIKRVVAALNYPGPVDWDYFGDDLHSIGGAMKQYLRDLPEPLLTFSLYSRWLTAARDIQADQDTQLVKPKNLAKLQQLINELPDINLAQLRYLNSFFAEMAKYAEESKMTAANIGIVMGANMLWPQRPDASALTDAHVKNYLVEILISNHDKIFPGFHFRPTMPLYFTPPSVSATGAVAPSSVAARKGSGGGGDVVVGGGGQRRSLRNSASSSLGSVSASVEDLCGSSDSLDDILDSDKSDAMSVSLTLPRTRSGGNDGSFGGGNTAKFRSTRHDRKSLKMAPPPPPANRAKSPSLHQLPVQKNDSTSIPASSASSNNGDGFVAKSTSARPPTLPVKVRNLSSTSSVSSPTSASSAISSPSTSSSPEDTIVVTRTVLKRVAVIAENDYEEIADPADESRKKPAISPKPKLDKEFWPIEGGVRKYVANEKKDDNNNNSLNGSSTKTNDVGTNGGSDNSLTVRIKAQGPSTSPVRPDSLPPPPPSSAATKRSERQSPTRPSTSTKTTPGQQPSAVGPSGSTTSRGPLGFKMAEHLRPPLNRQAPTGSEPGTVAEAQAPATSVQTQAPLTPSAPIYAEISPNRKSPSEN